MNRGGILLLSVLIAGCAGSLKRDRRPYRFASGLVNDGDPLGSKVKQRRRRKVRQVARRSVPRGRPARLERWRKARIARAREAIGKAFTAPREFLGFVLGPSRVGVARSRAARRLSDDALPGDLVVFDNTHDANSNRRLDDRRSGIGVVLSANAAGATFVYLSGSHGRRGVLSFRDPGLRRRGRRIVNSFVRVKSRHDPSGTRYLAGELLAGFTSLAPR